MKQDFNGTVMSKGVFSVVDLFCGAGGLSSGFIDEGFRLLKAIDHSRCAVATYARNLGHHVQRGDITESIELPRVSAGAQNQPPMGA